MSSPDRMAAFGAARGVALRLLALSLAGSQPTGRAALAQAGLPAAPAPPKTEVETQATGPGSIIQTDFTDQGQPNFDLVALQGHGLVHYWRANGDVLQPWHRGEVITTQATGPGAIIQSDYGEEFRGGHGNLEVVVPEGDHLTEYWKNSNQDGPWTKYASFGSGVTGAPSFIQSDMGREFGQHGNFEVVVPEGQTIAHYYRINGPTPSAWMGGPTNITNADSPATLIQSDYTYQGHGNLELLVRQGDQVAHWWHVHREPDNAWHEGQPFAQGVTGTPALIQSSFGRENLGQHGNEEALVPEGNNLQQWFRPDGQQWQPANRPPGNQDPSSSILPGTFYSPASFIQSTLGKAHDNFEMVALVGLNPQKPQDQFPADAVAGPGAGDPEFVLKQFYQDNSGDDPSRPWMPAQEITYRDRSGKVCQVTGQGDRESGRPTATAASAQRANVNGTDLGCPVDDGSTLRLFFGDTKMDGAVNLEGGEVGDDDAVMDVTGTQAPTPETCLQGASWEQAPGTDTFTPATVSPAIPQGLFNVPSSGFTLGTSRYMFFWTGHCAYPDKDHCPHSGQFDDKSVSYDPSGQAVLTKYDPASDRYDQVFPANGKGTNGTLYNPLPGKFGYTASVNSDDYRSQGLPDDQLGYVYVWSDALINPDDPNSGTYRNADPVLMRIPDNDSAVANRSTWQYFAGWDQGGAPIWSSNPNDEQDLFPPTVGPPPPDGTPAPPNRDYCTGESSVNWIAPLHEWLMLYNCAPHGGEPIKTGIVARVAPAPWGPWSATSQVFDAVADNAYCRYMHNPAGGPGGPCHDNLDENGGAAGAEYAPYVLPRYTTANPDGSASIYYMMSTWNPYQAVVMHMNLTSP